MDKFTRFQKICIALITVSVVFTFITKGSARIVTKLVYDPLVMLKYSLIDAPIRTVKDWIDDFNALWQVHMENEQLREAISQYPMDEAKYETQSRELSELKNLMDVNKEYHKIYASIINHNPENWNNIVTINVGSNEGVKEDQAVVSESGMVGKVISVSNMTSKVRLLTSQDQLSKVAVKILSENTYYEGILEEYNLESGSFVIRLFSNVEDIKIGEMVVTSGSGGVFPNGLLIGVVNEIVELPNEIGRMVYVTPAANFNSFSYVAVVSEVE